jgi:HEAT repeat protein
MQDVKELIRDLEKAKKNIRMYPSNNPVYVKTIDNLYGKISNLLDHSGELILKFKQYEILHDGAPVYKNKDKHSSLAMFFFKDGIRELTLKKGITRDETRELMEVISAEFDEENPEDDLVTLLWDCELQHVNYVVDNTFLLEDENYQQKAVENLKQNAAGSSEILGAYGESAHMPEVAVMDVPAFTDEDLNKILEEKESDPAENTRKLLNLLLEILTQAESDEEYKTIKDIVKAIIKYSAKHESVTDLVYIIEKIQTCAAEHSGEAEVDSCTADMLNYINTSEFITLFGSILENAAFKDDALLYKFVALFSKDAIEPLINMLAEQDNISTRKALTKILTELGKIDVSLLTAHLSDDRWYLVRNIIYILRQINDPSTYEYIMQYVAHENKKVKIEAITALGEMGTEKVLSVLKDCIYDEDNLTRMISIRATGNIKTAAAKKIILGVLNSKVFRSRSFNEKMTVFKTLSQWKEDDVIDALLKILNKTTFFKKDKHDEARAGAAYCISLMNMQEPPEILLKLQNAKNSLLQKNATAAVKKIKDG